MNRLLAVAVMTLGCGKAPPDPPKAGSGSGSAAPVTKAGSGSGSATAAATKKREHKKETPPTTEQKAELKARMKTGWAAQKDKEWAKAVTEFEAALVAVPGEPRALAELGWSAMNAGDFKKARTADEQAIAVAVDKKVKAAGYFNLGTVQEKTGDKDGALKSYVASLALRPNKTVMAAVGKLGTDPAAGNAKPLCAAGAPPCDCLKANFATPDMNSDIAKCTSEPASIAGFKIWKLDSDDTWSATYTYLFDDAGRYVADLETDRDHRGGLERIKVEKLEVKPIGDHKVLWIETSVEDSTQSVTDDGYKEEGLTGRQITICVVGDAKAPTRCPLVAVPARAVYDTSFDEENGKPKSQHSTETVLDVALGTDGVVTIKLTSGPSDEQLDALVGPHKLW
jgi:Tfp pilus assembly protein PilF